MASSPDFTDSSHMKTELGKSDKDDDLGDLHERKVGGGGLAAMRAYSAAYAHPATAYNPYHQQQQLHQQQHAVQQQSPQVAPPPPPPPPPAQTHASATAYYQQQQQGHGYSHGQMHETSDYGISKNPLSRDCGVPIPATKPKIWSVADTVACKTPPPVAYLGQHYYQQQQQQQHHHHQPPTHMSRPLDNNNNNNNGSNSSGNSNSSSSNNNNNIAQPQQLMHNSPLNMMNSYVSASPYSRIPMGYTAAVTPAGSFGSSSNTNNSNHHSPTGTGLISPGALQGRQQMGAQQQQHAYQQQRVGFPEIQPDTPPQTPPNMKLVAATHSNGPVLNPLLHGPSAPPTVATPTTAICYSNGKGHAHTHAPANSYRDHQLSPPVNGYLANLTVARAEA